MSYKVVITPKAKHSLKNYIRYTKNILQNKEAASLIRDDAKNTKERLAKIANILPLCTDADLAKSGYRKIPFKKHDFFMIYRIDGNKVIVEQMYHALQDYESTFIQLIQSPEKKEGNE